MLTDYYSQETCIEIFDYLRRTGQVDTTMPDKDTEPDKEAGNRPEHAKTRLSWLIEQQQIDEDMLFLHLSRLYALRRLDSQLDRIDTRLNQIIPHDLLRTFRLFAVNLSGDELEIALIDPQDRRISDQLKSGFKKIHFVLIKPSDYLALTSHPEFQKLVLSRPARDASPAHQIEDAGGAAQGVVPALVMRLLQEAVEKSASDIHIEQFRTAPRIRIRIDGELNEYNILNDELKLHYESIITRLKLMADCDIAERRLPQDGAFTVRIGAEDIDFRISFVPARYGNRAVLRILSSDNSPKLHQLGLSQQHSAQIIQAITAPQGMVLVTGPTGSGKTTSLYACLDYINQPARNIMTAEDPVEYYLEGISQIEINERISLSFEQVLRAFLRQDPEVILLGEIRDRQTADIAIKASLTGHLLLSSLHTNDAVSTVTRLSDMGVPSYLLANALRLVIAQRLARKLCPHCTEEERPQNIEHFIAEQQPAIPPEMIMTTRGCAACDFTGYQGRIGLYEVLVITPALEAALNDGCNAGQLTIIARKEGFCSLQEAGIDAMNAGMLGIGEFLRVLGAR